MSSSLPFIDTNLNLSLESTSILIHNRKYILPCQNRFSRRPLNEIIKKEYERVSDDVKQSIGKNQMSVTDGRAKQAFPELEDMIENLYSKPLSPKLYRRARHEHRIVKRLQKLLHSRPDIVVCRIDKGEGFYFGSKTTMEQKIEEYMEKTNAYEEVTRDRCRLHDILHSTEIVLDYLVKRKAISLGQRKQLLPNVGKMELAYLYALPKIHKVH